jgi:hypothetical protein
MIKYEEMLENPKSGIKNILEFLGDAPSVEKVDLIIKKTRARVKDGGPLRDGRHIRTGGRSVARDELPESLLQELLDLQKRYESGQLTSKEIVEFRKRSK